MWKKCIMPVLAVLLLMFSMPAAADARLDEQLISAAGKGDTAEVRRLLDRGANIEAQARYYDCPTPLTAAIKDNQDAAMRFLIGKGAKIEGRNCDGNTPLIVAGEAGNETAIALLLDKGAAVDAINHRGMPALIRAAAAGKAGAVKLLLAHGANVNFAASGSNFAKSDNGTTALIAAAQYGSPEVVQLLLDHGADIRARTEDGHTAFVYALMSSTPEAMAQPIRKFTAVMGREDYAGALVTVASSFKPNSIAAILKLAGGLLTKEDLNKALLAAAAAATWGNCSVDTDCQDTVKLLLESGADVDARDADGNTAFMLAVVKSDEWSVESFLRVHGADIRARNNAGNTAIVEAAIHNVKKSYLVALYDAEEVRYAINIAKLYGSQQALEGMLQEVGAPPAAFAWKSDNVYGDAAATFQPDLEYLVSSTGHRPDLGRIAVYAAEHDDCAFAERLVRENPGINPNTRVDGMYALLRDETTTLFASASQHCPTGFVKLLADRGASVSASSGMLFTGPHSDDALADATYSGNIDTVKLLFAKGAKIDPTHDLVLINAACSGNPAMLDLILEKGAGVWTAKLINDAFLQSMYRGCAAALPVLIRHGASIEDYYALRRSYSLWYAAGAGSVEVVKLLLEKHRDGFTPQDVRSAIVKACENGKPEALDAILAAGFKLDNPGEALAAAAGSGSVATVQRVLELGAAVNGTDSDGKSALFYAAARGNTEVVRLLLERGARIDARTVRGDTALIAAARSGYKGATHIEDKYAATVALLLERGAQANIVGNDGERLLIPDQATFKEIMGMMAHGTLRPANADYDGVDGWSALSWAAYTCNTPAVTALLDKGAALETADVNGNTPLILAAFHCDVDTVQVLVDRGANLKTRNKKGYTALALARLTTVDNETGARRKAPVIALLEQAEKGK